MRLRYTKPDGVPVEVTLGPAPVTLGRSPESDVVVPDERVSRIHCGIRLWDGEYTIRDLKSTNGTFVNGRRVDTATLSPGDVIKVGSTSIAFESEAATGPNTALREINAEMEQGKGYHTILKELVGGPPSEPPAAVLPPASEPVAEVAEDAPAANPMLVMPTDSADAADAGVDMGPEDASRPPPSPALPPGDPARKKLRIVVKKRFNV